MKVNSRNGAKNYYKDDEHGGNFSVDDLVNLDSNGNTDLIWNFGMRNLKNHLLWTDSPLYWPLEKSYSAVE